MLFVFLSMRGSLNAALIRVLNFRKTSEKIPKSRVAFKATQLIGSQNVGDLVDEFFAS